jgi:hypothetical protein
MRNQIIFWTLAFSVFSTTLHAGDIQFWDMQRKGANFFPNVPTAERFKDASKAGIVIARLAGSKQRDQGHFT